MKLRDQFLYLTACFVALGLLTIVATPSQVFAQEPAKGELPVATPCREAIANIATCYSAKHASGAYLLAVMPKNWNGNLIVFAHGGPALVPPTASYSQTDLAKYTFGVKRGFAWVASSYRREGYGVRMAAADTEDARRDSSWSISRSRNARSSTGHLTAAW